MSDILSLDDETVSLTDSNSFSREQELAREIERLSANVYTSDNKEETLARIRDLAEERLKLRRQARKASVMSGFRLRTPKTQTEMVDRRKLARKVRAAKLHRHRTKKDLA